MRSIRPTPFFYLGCIIALYEFQEMVQFPTTLRLLENAICQRHYFSIDPGGGPVEESECKTGAIQRHLALVRGWNSALNTLPILLFGHKFSQYAERSGRRLMLCFTMTGMMIALLWIYITCTFWNTFPPEFVFFTALFRIIGGGPFIAIALHASLCAELSTSETRSQNLYRLFCFKFLMDLVSPQIASALLRNSLWLPYLLCGLSLLLTLPLIYLMGKASTTAEVSASATIRHTIHDETGLQTIKRFCLRKGVLLGLVIDFLVQVRYNSIQIVPVYVSMRFNWTIAKTAHLLSIIPGISLAIYLMLPWLTDFLQHRRNLSKRKLDFLVVLLSCLSLTLGSALMCLAPKISTMILALTVFAPGFNVRVPILALMANYVDHDGDRTMLFTLISMVDALGHMIWSPAVEALWALAVSRGGSWQVLQFAVLTGFLALASLLATFLPVPSSTDQTTRQYEEREREREALLHHNE